MHQETTISLHNICFGDFQKISYKTDPGDDCSLIVWSFSNDCVLAVPLAVGGAVVNTVLQKGNKSSYVWPDSSSLVEVCSLLKLNNIHFIDMDLSCFVK